MTGAPEARVGKPRRTDMTRLLLIVPALVLLALAPSARAEADHYLCYAAKSKVQGYPEVKLEDQFGAGSSKVGILRFLCNPVDKNGEGIPDKEAHLACYEVKPAIKPKKVVIANQFGEDKPALGAPGLLCVPTKKALQ